MSRIWCFIVLFQFCLNPRLISFNMRLIYFNFPLGFLGCESFIDFTPLSCSFRDLVRVLPRSGWILWFWHSLVMCPGVGSAFAVCMSHIVSLSMILLSDKKDLNQYCWKTQLKFMSYPFQLKHQSRNRETGFHLSSYWHIWPRSNQTRPSLKAILALSRTSQSWQITILA